MSNSPNDNHFHAIEEKRHREHMEIRAARLHGDGTIEQEEAELSRVRAIKHRRDAEALKAANKVWREEVAALMASGYSFDAACQFAGQS